MVVVRDKLKNLSEEAFEDLVYNLTRAIAKDGKLVRNHDYIEYLLSVDEKLPMFVLFGPYMISQNNDRKKFGILLQGLDSGRDGILKYLARDSNHSFTSTSKNGKLTQQELKKLMDSSETIAYDESLRPLLKKSATCQISSCCCELKYTYRQASSKFLKRPLSSSDLVANRESCIISLTKLVERSILQIWIFWSEISKSSSSDLDKSIRASFYLRHFLKSEAMIYLLVKMMVNWMDCITCCENEEKQAIPTMSKNIKNKNIFQLSAIIFIFSIMIPLLPSGSFLSTFNSAIIWINFAIMVGFSQRLKV